MVNDDDRRDVAARLRKAIGLHEFAEVLGFNWTDDSDWAWKDVSNLVADLIEPSKPEGTCGNCRHFIKDRFMPCDAARGYTEADVSACEDFSPLSCDRDALLEIAQAMDSRGKCTSEENGGDGEVDAWWLRQYAHLIRETLGVDDGW